MVNSKWRSCNKGRFPGWKAALLPFLVVTPSFAQDNIGLIPADTLLGRDTAGVGQVEVITLGTGLTMNGSKVLSSPPASDGDYGDIIISGGSTVYDIDPTAVISGTTPLIEIEGTSAGAVGPVLKIQHDSASPAANDVPFDLQVFAGTDDQEVGRIAYRVIDGSTTEDGAWDIYADNAGASLRQMTIGGSSEANPLLLSARTDLRYRLTMEHTRLHFRLLGMPQATTSQPSGFLGPELTLSSRRFGLASLRGITGSYDIVSDGDALGNIHFSGADGTGFQNAAAISAVVDGTPGSSNDMPGQLQFATVPDNSGTAAVKMAINNAGQVILGEGVNDAVGDPFGGFTNSAAIIPKLQVIGNTNALGSASIIRASNDTVGSTLYLGKTRDGTPNYGGVTASGDKLGSISFKAQQLLIFKRAR